MPLLVRTCRAGIVRCLFPWAGVISSPFMDRHMRIYCSSLRSSAGFCRFSTTSEGEERNGHDTASTFFGSDGTENIDAPQSSPQDTGPHRCGLQISRASCACSGIATSGMSLRSSVNASGLSGTIPDIVGGATVGYDRRMTFELMSFCKKAGSCYFRLHICHLLGDRAFGTAST